MDLIIEKKYQYIFLENCLFSRLILEYQLLAFCCMQTWEGTLITAYAMVCFLLVIACILSSVSFSLNEFVERWRVLIEGPADSHLPTPSPNLSLPAPFIANIVSIASLRFDMTTGFHAWPLIRLTPGCTECRSSQRHPASGSLYGTLKLELKDGK